MAHWRTRRTGAPSAFTLIELLVVMAVIMMLAALLSPMIRQSVSLAARTQCIGQLKQLGVGMQMYSNNWDMHILPAYRTYSDPKETFVHAPGFDYWWHGVGREGYLWPNYVNDVKVFICPNNTSSNPQHSCSYTHNWAPWNGVPDVTEAQRKVQRVDDPTRTIVVTESYNPVIWDWQYKDGSGSLFPRLLDRHGSGDNKGCCCLYIDGRADFRVRLKLDIPDFTPINDHGK